MFFVSIISEIIGAIAAILIDSNKEPKNIKNISE